MGNTLKSEFKLKHFAFHECRPDRFYTSQWTKSKWIFFVFKFVLLAYWLGWFAADLAVSSIPPQSLSNWWIYLTHWGVVTILLYLMTSFLIVVYGIIQGDPKSPHATKLSTVSGSISIEREIAAAESKVRWFHIIVWILQMVALDVSIAVTVLYWSLLTIELSPFSINNHLINMIIMIIDLFFNDIPVRVLHFYHISLFSLTYTVFSLILHGTGYASAIYPVLNWATNPGISAGMCIGLIIIGCPILHAIVFALYRLRLLIAEKTVLKRKVTPAVTMNPIDNPIFEGDEQF